MRYNANFQTAAAKRTAALAVSMLATLAGARPSAAQCVNESWTDFTFDRFTLHLDSRVGSDHLLVGTHSGGVLDWDTADHTFIKYTHADNCLSDNAIIGVAMDGEGGYWAVTNFGVNHLPATNVGDPDAQWIQIADPEIQGQLFTCIAVDAQNRKWIGTYEGGIYRFDGASWTNFNTSNSGLSDNFITSIDFDLQGNAWIGAWSAGVDRFDGETWTNFNPQNTGTPPGLCGPVTVPPDDLGLLSVFVRVAGVDPSTGDVWFINDDDSFCVPAGNGATKFDGEGWSTFTSGNSGLLTDFLGDIGFGPDGSILFGTLNGLSRFDGAKWETIFDGDGRAITTVGSQVWIGTGMGLAQLVGDDITLHDTGQLADSYVPGIAIHDDGAIWLATRNGAQRLAIDDQGQASWTTYHTGNSPIVGNDLTSVAIDASNHIWFGTFGQGVSRFDGVSWVSFPEALVGQVVTIAGDIKPGVVWFGDAFGGVKKYDNGVWTSFATGSGIPSALVHKVTVDEDGVLWVATVAGVGRFDGQQWTTFTTSDGLPSNLARALYARPGGEIWVGTINGASVFDGKTWTNHLPGADVRAISAGHGCDIWISVFNEGVQRFDGTSFAAFNVADGLINDRVHAIARSHDGTLWMGSELGVSRLDGEASNPADVAPPASGGNGAVDVDDLLLVINNWGQTGDNVADINGDDIVKVDDLLAVINAWGPCHSSRN